MSSSDPRERVDGLGWVTRAVFPDDRVRVRLGEAAPADEEVVARYAVVPSVDRARFLLPLASRAIAAASMHAYNGLRPRKVALPRAVIGGSARLGLAHLPGLPRLTVSVPAGVKRREVLLADQISEVLGIARLHAALGIRPPDPNHKPTLQLFDDRAKPRGYAKIGWNDATRALVRAETAALRNLPERGGPDYPIAPRLLAADEFGGQVIAVIEPLPSNVRRLDVTEPPQLKALLAIARRGGPAAAPQQVRGSAFLDRLSGGADTAAATVPEGRIAQAAVAALLARDGDLTLEFGDWHGDWVPWNLGRAGGELVAWDWEHSAPGMPIGLDLAHEGFQMSLILDGATAHVAATASAARMETYGGQLGLDARQRRFVVDAYLLEMWLRTCRLAAGGAGWNDALHPALPHILTQRLELTA